MSSQGSVRTRIGVREREAVAAGQGSRPTRFLRAVLAQAPLALRGLRSRLVAAFALVAVVSALSTGALAFREARTGVLQQSQDAVIRQFRTSVDAVAVYTPLAPSQSDLQVAVNQVLRANQAQGWQVMATYEGLRAYTSTDVSNKLSLQLRLSVETARAAVFQRVNADGRPYLVVGMPVTYNSGEGTKSELSGLVMYLVVPQNTEQAYVEAMVSAIEHATLVALCLAVVLALLAASGVLRPVRALRRATRRMAEGTSMSGWPSTAPTNWPTSQGPSTTRRPHWRSRSRSCAAWRPGRAASSRTSLMSSDAAGGDVGGHRHAGRQGAAPGPGDGRGVAAHQ